MPSVDEHLKFAIFAVLDGAIPSGRHIENGESHSNSEIPLVTIPMKDPASTVKHIALNANTTPDSKDSGKPADNNLLITMSSAFVGLNPFVALEPAESDHHYPEGRSEEPFDSAFPTNGLAKPIVE